MTYKTFRQSLGYTLIFVILSNFIMTPFLSSTAFAQQQALPETATLTEAEQQARIEAINKAQWDGALAIKSFTLPGLDNTASTGVGDDGVVSDLTDYQDADGNHRFDSIKMDQMFQGFSIDTHEEYLSQLSDMSDEAHKIQDASADFQATINDYDDIVCDDLQDPAEQRKCSLSKNAQILDDIRNNIGRNEFLGSEDPILTAFSPFTDGTHPYFAELQSQECVEITNGISDEDGEGLQAERYCLVPTDYTSELQCKVEQYVQSTKIDEKVIMDFTPRGSYDNFNHGFRDGLIKPCDDEEDLEDGVSCLEVRLLNENDWKREGFPIEQDWYFYNGNTRSDDWGIDFAPHVEFTEITQTIHSILSGPGVPSYSLSDYEYAFQPDYTSNFTVGTYSVIQKWNQNRNGRPDFIDFNYGYGECVSENYVLAELGLIQAHQNIGHSYLNEYACNAPGDVDYSGGNESFSLFNSPWEQNFFTPYDEGTGTIFDFYYHFADPLFFDDDPDSNITAVTNALEGKMVNLISTKFYFTAPAIPGEVLPTETEIFENAIIDDNDDYPKNRLHTILDEAVLLKFDVFDQGTYPVSEYFPTNIRVEGDSVTSWSLESIGRPTDRYKFKLNIEFDSVAPFKVWADLHRIDDKGVRPLPGEPAACATVIPSYLNNAAPATAMCDYIIEGENQRVFDSGVPLDVAHIGYFQFMTDWGENGNPPLPHFCHDATIIIDPAQGGGLQNQDRAMLCSTLTGSDYDNCMQGLYCQPDLVNGGEACYEIGASLQRSFEDSCANYISDSSCEYKPEATQCEDFIEVDGEMQCLFQSHMFLCDEGGNGYTMPTENQTTEIVCGTPRDCMNGTCNAIKEESNDAFLRATALQNIANEARSNRCSIDEALPLDDQLESCTLFDGTPGRCKQAKVFGAPDCCDPEELGMGGIDVVAYWQTMSAINASVEQMTGAGLMAHAWGAVKDTDAGIIAGDTVTSIDNYLTGQVDNAYTFVNNAISTGWTNTMSTLGFSNSAQAFQVAPDLSNLTQAISANAASAVENTTLSIETLAEEVANQQAGIANPASAAEVTTAVTNTALQSGGAVPGAGCDENCLEIISEAEGGMTGMAKYIAQGINSVLEDVAPNLASDLFVTNTTDEGVSQIAFNTSEPLGELAGQIFNAFSVIMTVYQIYSAYRLVVNLAFACDDMDYTTTQKTKLLQSHYIGSYCSSELLIGGCIEYSQVHCVYESVFSRILAEQIRKVQAINTGVSEESLWLSVTNEKMTENNINCSGFNLVELGEIDWDQIDLSEYEQILLAKMKYDPNNVPEDFVKSDYLSGSRTGPQAGTTIKEDGTAQAIIASKGADYGRSNITAHNMQLDDPDYMAWYEAADPGVNGQQCIVMCDTANGYSYNSGSSMCEKVSYTPHDANYSCDTENGYQLHTKPNGAIVCRQTTTTAIQSGCREGFALDTDDNLCYGENVQSETPTPQCPTDYRLDDGLTQCILEEVVDQVINCSSYGEGYQLIDGACTRTDIDTIEPVVTCPSDEHYLVDGECVITRTAEHIISCPLGLTYDEQQDRCIEVSTSSEPAIFDCSSHGVDYTLVENRCEKVTLVNATFECNVSEGFSLNADGECSRIITGTFEPLSKCPEGYLPFPSDDTQCYKRIPAPLLAEPYCSDPSFTLVNGGICEKITDETLPAEEQCAGGGIFDPVLSQCQVTHSYPANITCPEAMSFNSSISLCEGIQTNSSQPIYECSNPTDILEEQTCISQEAIGFSLSCPEGYVLNTDTETCRNFEVETVVASYWCPPGSSESAGYCYTHSSQDPIKVCPEPSVENISTGECELTNITVTEPVSTCPYPSFRHTDGSCVIKETITPDTECPVDINNPWDFNSHTQQCERTILLVEPSTTVCADDDSECPNAVYQDPVPTCVNGTANLATGICEDYIYTYPDPYRNCDTSNDYVYLPNLDICQKHIELSAITCGVDYTFDINTGRCEYLVETSAVADCALGFAFDGNICRKVTQLPLECEDPTTVFNPLSGVCEGLIVEPAIVQCVSPYTVDTNNPGQCILPSQYTPTCDVANQVTQFNTNTQQCEHDELHKEVPPLEECTQGLLVDGRCSDGTSQAPLCPVGSLLNPLTDICDRVTPDVELYCITGTLIQEASGSICQSVESKLPECANDSYFDEALNMCVERLEEQGVMTCLGNEERYGVLSGSQCINYQLADYIVDDICPEGFTAHSSSKCIRQLPISPPLFSCPGGYQQLPFNGVADYEAPLCFKTVETEPHCSGSFVLQGDRCVDEHEVAPQESCLVNGVRLFGSHCTASFESSPICANDTYYSVEHDVCINLQSTAANISCDEDYYHYDGASETCKSTLSEDPECAVGYSFNATIGLCEQIQLLPECPETFTYDSASDQCLRYLTESADTSCDPLLYDNGIGCVATVAPECPTEYTLDPIRDECWKIDTLPYQTQCDFPFVSNGDQCVLIDAVDCSAIGGIWDANSEVCVVAEQTPAIPEACPELSVLVGGECRMVEDVNCATLGPDFLYDTNTGSCKNTYDVAPIIACPEGQHDLGNGCSDLPAFECDSGYTYDPASNLCAKEETQLREIDCNGEVQGQICVTTYPSLCSGNATLNNGVCEEDIQTPARPLCNAPFEDMTNQCVEVKGPICPPFYMLDENVVCEYLGVDVCLDDFITQNCNPRFVPPLCPPEERVVGFCGNIQPHNDRCDLPAQLNGSVCVETISSQPICGAGYDFDGSQCRNEQPIALEDCPVGWDQTPGTCERVYTHIPNCDAGYEFDSVIEQCRLSSPNDYLETCPDISQTAPNCTNTIEQPVPCSAGYSYEASLEICVSNSGSPLAYGCPAGMPAWVLNGNVCERTVDEAPHCDQGTYDPSITACTVDTRPFNPTCPNGYVDNSGNCQKELTAIPNCGVGFNYDTQLNVCVATDVQTYLYACDEANGFEADPNNPSQCERFDYVAPSCQSGELVDDICAIQQFDTPRIDCGVFGPNFIHQNGACESAITSGLTCINGGLADGDISPMHMQCHDVSTAPGALTCLDGFNLAGDTCSFNYDITPILACDDGYEINFATNICEKKEYELAVHSCDAPANLLNDDKSCRQLEIQTNQPVEEVCGSPGFTLDNFGRCVMLNGQGLNEYCTNALYSLVPLDDPIEGGAQYQCELLETEYTPPLLSCPEALPPYEIGSSNSCERLIDVPPSMSCPVGFIFNQDDDSCLRESEDVVPAEYTCNEPYQLNIFNQCVLTEIDSATLVCEAPEQSGQFCEVVIGDEVTQQYADLSGSVSYTAEDAFSMQATMACYGNEPCYLTGNATGDYAVAMSPTENTVRFYAPQAISNTPVDQIDQCLTQYGIASMNQGATMISTPNIDHEEHDEIIFEVDFTCDIEDGRCYIFGTNDIQGQNPSLYVDVDSHEIGYKLQSWQEDFTASMLAVPDSDGTLMPIDLSTPVTLELKIFGELTADNKRLHSLTLDGYELITAMPYTINTGKFTQLFSTHGAINQKPFNISRVEMSTIDDGNRDTYIHFDMSDCYQEEYSNLGSYSSTKLILGNYLNAIIDNTRPYRSISLPSDFDMSLQHVYKITRAAGIASLVVDGSDIGSTEFNHPMVVDRLFTRGEPDTPRGVMTFQELILSDPLLNVQTHRIRPICDELVMPDSIGTLNATLMNYSDSGDSFNDVSDTFNWTPPVEAQCSIMNGDEQQGSYIEFNEPILLPIAEPWQVSMSYKCFSDGEPCYLFGSDDVRQTHAAILSEEGDFVLEVVIGGHESRFPIPDSYLPQYFAELHISRDATNTLQVRINNVLIGEEVNAGVGNVTQLANHRIPTTNRSPSELGYVAFYDGEGEFMHRYVPHCSGRTLIDSSFGENIDGTLINYSDDDEAVYDFYEQSNITDVPVPENTDPTNPYYIEQPADNGSNAIEFGLLHARHVETNVRVIPNTYTDDWFVEWEQLDNVYAGTLFSQNYTGNLGYAGLEIRTTGMYYTGNFFPFEFGYLRAGQYRLEVEGNTMRVFYNGRMVQESAIYRTQRGSDIAKFTIGATHNYSLTSTKSRINTGTSVLPVANKVMRMLYVKAGLLNGSSEYFWDFNQSGGSQILERNFNIVADIKKQYAGHSAFTNVDLSLPDVPESSDPTPLVLNLLQFDGYDDYASMSSPLIDAINGDYAFTMNLTASVKDGVIVAQTQSPMHDSAFRIGVEHSQFAVFRGGEYVIFNNQPVVQGEYRIETKASDLSVSLYHEGVLVETKTLTGTPVLVNPEDANTPFTVGARLHEDMPYDHARFLQISSLKVEDLTDNSVMADWSFNRSSGVEVTDSANGHVLTLHNMEDQWKQYSIDSIDASELDIYGLKFDGVDDTLESKGIGPINNFDITIDFELHSMDKQMIAHLEDAFTIGKPANSNRIDINFFIHGNRQQSSVPISEPGRYKLRATYDGRKTTKMWLNDELIDTFIGWSNGPSVLATLSPNKGIVFGSNADLSQTDSYSDMTLYEVQFSANDKAFKMHLNAFTDSFDEMLDNVSAEFTTSSGFTPGPEKWINASRNSALRHALLFDGVDDFVETYTDMTPSLTGEIHVDFEIFDDIDNGTIVAQTRSLLDEEKHFEIRVEDGLFRSVVNGNVVNYGDQHYAIPGQYRFMFYNSGARIWHDGAESAYYDKVNGTGYAGEYIDEVGATTSIGARYNSTFNEYTNHVDASRFGYVRFASRSGWGNILDHNLKQISFNQKQGGVAPEIFNIGFDGTLYNFPVDGSMWVIAPDATLEEVTHNTLAPVARHVLAFDPIEHAQVVETNTRLIEPLVDDFYINWHQLDTATEGVLASQNVQSDIENMEFAVFADGIVFGGKFTPLNESDTFTQGDWSIEVSGSDMVIYHNDRVFDEYKDVRSVSGEKEPSATFAIGAAHNGSLGSYGKHYANPLTAFDYAPVRLLDMSVGLLDGSSTYEYSTNQSNGSFLLESNQGAHGIVIHQGQASDMWIDYLAGVQELPRLNDLSAQIARALYLDYKTIVSFDEQFIDIENGSMGVEFETLTSIDNGVIISQSQSEDSEAGFKVKVENSILSVIRGGQKATFNGFNITAGVWRIWWDTNENKVLLFKNGIQLSQQTVGIPELSSPYEDTVPIVIGARYRSDEQAPYYTQTGFINHATPMVLTNIKILASDYTTTHHLQFNQSSGLVVTDIVTGALGTISGAEDLTSHWVTYDKIVADDTPYDTFAVQFDGFDDHILLSDVGAIEDITIEMDVAINSQDAQVLLDYEAPDQTSIVRIEVSDGADDVRMTIERSGSTFVAVSPLSGIGRYQFKFEYDGKQGLRIWADNHMSIGVQTYLPGHVSGNAISDMVIGTSVERESQDFSTMTLFSLEILANAGLMHHRYGLSTSLTEPTLPDLEGHIDGQLINFGDLSAKLVPAVSEHQVRYSLLFDGYEDFVQLDDGILPSFNTTPAFIDVELIDTIDFGTIISQTQRSEQNQRYFEWRVVDGAMEIIINGTTLDFGDQVSAEPGHYRLLISDAGTFMVKNLDEVYTEIPVRGPSSLTGQIFELTANTVIGARYDGDNGRYVDHMSYGRLGYVSAGLLEDDATRYTVTRNHVSFNEKSGGVLQGKYDYSGTAQLFNFSLDNTMWVPVDNDLPVAPPYEKPFDPPHMPPLLTAPDLPAFEVPDDDSNDGWEVSNGFCEREVIIDEIPAADFCSGSLNDDGLCVGNVETPATPQCPAGAVYSAALQSCEIEEVVTAEPTDVDCPTGVNPQLDATTCTYHEVFPSNGLGCLGPGWDFDPATHECSIYLRETQEPVLCDDDLEQRFRQCYDKEFIDAEYVCPDGSTQDNNTGLCSGTVTDLQAPDTICQPGYLTVGSQCRLTEYEIPDISCADPSYTLVSEYCYQDTILTDEDPILTCPMNYLEVDGLCTYENIQPGLPECPDMEWEYNSEALMCERATTQVLRPDVACPDAGFELVGANKCARVIETQPFEMTCPEGVLEDGFCIITSEVSHEPNFCFHPSIMVNGQCESYKESYAVVSCPDVEGVVQTVSGCALKTKEIALPTSSCD